MKKRLLLTTSPAEGGKTLVVYYSASGNTAAVAGCIADALGADIFTSADNLLKALLRGRSVSPRTG